MTVKGKMFPLTYNISLQAPQKQRRRPKTPAGASLPLGGYEEKRKALEKERQEDMKRELAKVSCYFFMRNVGILL